MSREGIERILLQEKIRRGLAQLDAKLDALEARLNDERRTDAPQTLSPMR